MTAKEMFEELGWEYRYVKEKDLHLITYLDIKRTYRIIDFYLDMKDYECYTNDQKPMKTINKKVLKAIDKQLEELGWK